MLVGLAGLWPDPLTPGPVSRRFHSDNVKTDEDAVLTMLKAAGLDANVQALSNASEGPGIIYALLTCVALCLLGV